ncbi:MAG: histidinol-phosphatase HisJ family protein [Acetobacteraceae bacterium]|nr:histidinol-phosphatase HisJ family protein [Acetobacteraceae bacterium]
MLIDYHVHTVCSWDGREAADAFCRRALELGLSEIALTPHAEFDPREPGFGRYQPLACLEEVQQAQERYGGRLEVLLGVEVSFQPQHTPRIAEFLAGWPYDLVIGSVHRVGEFDYSVPYGREGAGGPGPGPAGWSPEPYLEALLAAAESGLFDVLGHLDVLWRSAPPGTREKELDRAWPRMAQVVAVVARSGRGLELNTSGLYQGPGQTYPAFELLRHFRREGGKVLTLGSDAHTAASLGRGLEYALELASAAGFSSLTRFRRRRPQPFPLPRPAEARGCPPAPAPGSPPQAVWPSP